MSFFKKKPLALATLAIATLPTFAFASNPICKAEPSIDPQWLAECFVNTPATLLPVNKEIYYGRSTLPKEHQIVYDYILNQAGDWSDSTKMSNVFPLKTIDISMLPVKLTNTELNYILARMRDEVFHLYTQRPAARNVEYDYNEKVVRFDFRYTNKPLYDEYVKELEKIEAAVKPILAKIQPDMTEAQKVRLLHDELLKLVSYGQLNTLDPDNISGAFISNVIVCEGYAEALSYLLNLAGIKSIAVPGRAKGALHVWNKVFIDGLWYNIDPTWNDDVTGSGKFHHDFFLKADKNFTTHVPEDTDIHTFEIRMPTENLATEDYPFADTEYAPKHQVKVDNTPPQAKSVAIYSEPNLAGQVAYITESVSQLNPEMDNRLSSFYIPDGWVVQFFEEADYQGMVYTFTSKHPHNMTSLDDKISSIKVIVKRDMTELTPALYVESEQLGEPIKFVSDIAKLDSTLANNIGSFSIPEGWVIRLYEQENFQGSYYTRNQSGNEQFNKVGSVRVLAKPSSALVSQDQRVTLFDQSDFEGESIGFATDIPKLSDLMANSPASLSIPLGWQVRFYEQENYQGRYFTRDAKSNQGQNINFSFDVNSVKVFKKPDGATLPLTIKLYSEADLKGNVFVVTEDMPSFGSLFDDKMRSFMIPNGWKVRFYTDENYQGRYFTRDDSDNGNADGFTDQVSSMKILKKL